MTIILSILMVLAFLFAVFFVKDLDAFYNYYGFSGANLLARPYVLITSIFMHAGIEHLLSNLLVFIFFARAVEKEMGPWKMLAIFLLGAIGGDILSLLIYPFDAISVGASAGIFGLIGVGMLVCPMDLSLYPLIIPIPLVFVGIAYSLYNIYGFLFLPQSDISYIGHFGGLFVGLAVGFAKTGFKKGLRTLLLGLLILAMAIAAWFLISPRL